MTIKKLLGESIEGEYLYLQVLIMFLVFEKKVLTFDQDIRELDFYLQDKFKDKMNRLLVGYKQKLNLEHKPLIYEVNNKKATYLVKARTNDELESICFVKGIEIGQYRPCLLEERYEENGTLITTRELRNRKETVIGYY